MKGSKNREKHAQVVLYNDKWKEYSVKLYA